MTDRDVIQKAKTASGTGRVMGPYKRKTADGRDQKDEYRWVVTRWGEIEPLLIKMLPWLCKRRRKAAEKLLADPPGKIGQPLKTHCKRGHPMKDDNLYVNPNTGQRRCRACNKMWQKTKS